MHSMSEHSALSEFLVISRGQWDPSRTPEEIQSAIDRFYSWLEQHEQAGRMKSGQRLGRERRVVTERGVLDGPFAEAKEVIGGYWFIYARSLDDAARLAAENPCLAYGLSYEIRPIEHERASAFRPGNETPELR